MPTSAMDRREVIIDFVVKISETCNLACPYCYYYFQDFDNSKYARTIQPGVIERLGSFLAEGAAELGIDRVRLAFHGGEPLLIRKRTFEEICLRWSKALEGVVEYSFALQTNGTLIDEEWIDLFSRHKVHVGVSIDGPKEHHDRMRPDKRGRGSYDQSVRGLQRLRQAHQRGQLSKIGALCVADPGLSAKEVFSHFCEELDVPGFSLLLPRSGWGQGIEHAQDQWIEYFSDALDYWLPGLLSGNSSYNRLFSDAVLPMLSDKLAEMMDWRHSFRHHVITISSEGHLAADDNLYSVASQFSQSGMTIFNSSLREFMSSPFWNALIQATDSVPERCSSCEWHRVCRSGELYNRVDAEGRLGTHSVFCELLDSIFLRIAETLTQHGLSLRDLADRLNAKPKYRAADFTVEALLDRKNRLRELNSQAAVEAGGAVA